MRARNNRYQRNENYIDTTYYDKDNNYLDVGYQRMKVFHASSYSNLSTITKLFINNNSLSVLPSLPCLKELDCSTNQLASIPFYPSLTYLNATNNPITLSNYNGSSLISLHCCNAGMKSFGLRLPWCRDLYISGNELSSLDLNLVPSIQLLDCSNNAITVITKGSDSLIEIDFSNNMLESLPVWSKLKIIMGCHNGLSILETYPSTTTITVTYNKLTKISDQPSLNHLYVDHNKIVQIGHMPLIKTIDISHNKIKTINLSPTIKRLFIQFNPIDSLGLNVSDMTSIEEIHCSLSQYVGIFYDIMATDAVINIETCNSSDRLAKLVQFSNDKLNDYIKNNIHNKVRFEKRHDDLKKLAMKVHEVICSIKELKYIDPTRILELIGEAYYGSLVLMIYFNQH